MMGKHGSLDDANYYSGQDSILQGIAGCFFEVEIHVSTVYRLLAPLLLLVIL